MPIDPPPCTCRICLKDLRESQARAETCAGIPIVLCSRCWNIGELFRSRFAAEQELHRAIDESEDARHRLAEEEEAARHLAAVDGLYLRWREAVR